MAELKRWWITIAFSGCIILALGWVFSDNKSFKIKVDGKFLGPSYDISIPAEWMTPEIAERHHEAYFKFIEIIGKD